MAIIIIEVLQKFMLWNRRHEIKNTGIMDNVNFIASYHSPVRDEKLVTNIQMANKTANFEEKIEEAKSTPISFFLLKIKEKKMETKNNAK